MQSAGVSILVCMSMLSCSAETFDAEICKPATGSLARQNTAQPPDDEVLGEVIEQHHPSYACAPYIWRFASTGLDALPLMASALCSTW